MGVRGIVKMVFSVLDELFKINSYGIVVSRWEEHILRKSRPSVFKKGGVNIFCHPTILNSHAKTARDLSFKLAEAGIPCSVVDLSPPWDNTPGIHGRELDAVRRILECKAPFRKSIICGGTHMRPVSGYNSWWVAWCEFNNIPPRSEIFTRFAGVCCFSDFCRDIIKKAAPDQTHPVVKIRYPFIFPERQRGFERRAIRRKLGIPNEAFVVFFNFSFSAIRGRKNPEGVVAAFANAFQNDRQAWLVVKTDGSDGNSEKVASFETSIQSAGIGDRVRIIGSKLEMNEILDLTAAMDVYLSLHRSEGLGLGMLEAMSLGVPVVATGYGGNMEFMRTNNSFIVPFKYKTWTPDCGFPVQMTDWAEPDIKAAAQLLQYVRNNPGEVQERTRRGVSFVRDFYSLANFRNDILAFIDEQRTTPVHGIGSSVKEAGSHGSSTPSS